MQPIKLGNFMVGCRIGIVSIANEEGNPFTFSCGENEQIKHLLGIALAMEELPVLPESIDEGRFQIQFHEDNTMTLCDPDVEAGVRFSWLEGDELITRIDDGYKMAMNERQVGSAGSSPVSRFSENGEPFI